MPHNATIVLAHGTVLDWPFQSSSLITVSIQCFFGFSASRSLLIICKFYLFFFLSLVPVTVFHHSPLINDSNFGCTTAISFIWVRMLSFSVVLFRNAKLRIIHFTDHFLFCYVYIRLDQTLINRFVFCFRYYYCNFASSNFKISIFINIYMRFVSLATSTRSGNSSWQEVISKNVLVASDWYWTGS